MSEHDPTRYDVPATADPVRCPACGRPFTRETLLALHRGREHDAAIDDDVRDAYRAAHEEESARLGRFRLKVLLALIVLYFLLLMSYAVV